MEVSHQRGRSMSLRNPGGLANDSQPRRVTALVTMLKPSSSPVAGIQPRPLLLCITLAPPSGRTNA